MSTPAQEDPAVSFLKQIEEQRVEGKRLGRHVEHDPVSLRYPFKTVTHQLPTSMLHSRRTPVLNQGDLGSCTGNAMCGLLGTDPYYSTLTTDQQVNLTEPFAVDVLYHLATTLDEFPGTYTPDDTGSSGLAVAKAAQGEGLIAGYLHPLNLADGLAALAIVPTIVGTNWYDSFDEPDANGQVSISPNAGVRGAHEYELLGFDTIAKMVWAVNSWGEDYGEKGYFGFSFDTFDRLIHEQGDQTVMTPRSGPPPTPVPSTGTSLIIELGTKAATKLSTDAANQQVDPAKRAADVVSRHYRVVPGQ